MTGLEGPSPKQRAPAQRGTAEANAQGVTADFADGQARQRSGVGYGQKFTAGTTGG